MNEDIIGGKALRGREAVCPSIIISCVVSGKKPHQTQPQAIFFPPPRSAVLPLLSAYIWLPLSNPCNERLQSVSALAGPEVNMSC